MATPLPVHAQKALAELSKAWESAWQLYGSAQKLAEGDPAHHGKYVLRDHLENHGDKAYEVQQQLDQAIVAAKQSFQKMSRDLIKAVVKSKPVVRPPRMTVHKRPASSSSAKVAKKPASSFLIEVLIFGNCNAHAAPKANQNAFAEDGQRRTQQAC